MFTRIASTVAAAWLATIPAISQETLIPPGSTWRYWDQGPLSGQPWQTMDFDDSAWPAGPAQLGYGDGDEATVIGFGPDAGAKFIPSYFRRTFTVADPDAFPELQLDVLRDDGAVVYLNGIEVFRTNMPGSTISATTLAQSASGDDETTRFHRQIIPGSLLRPGTNVIAVAVHQDSAGSSDLSFDLRLTTAPAALIPKGSAWQFLDTGTDPGPAWITAAFDDSSWLTGRAQIGYGDGDEVTVAGFTDTDPDTPGIQKNITTWFRRKFTVSQRHAIASLQLELLRDDGAVVWLNGTEVLRSAMPTGTITPETLASQTATAAEEVSAFRTATLDPDLLVDGENVIAVEVHQDSPASSDLSFDLRLAAMEPELTRGPYLNRAAPTEMTIRWRTSVPTDSVVRWGTGPDSPDQTTSDPAITTEHIVRLTGLTPATRYHYAVGHSRGEFAADGSLFFTTSPPRGPARPFRFWALGDCGTGNSNARAVRDAFAAWNGSTHTDFVVLLGDNAYNTGLDSEFQTNFFGIYPDTLRNSPVWPCMGNHEAFNSDSPTETGPYYTAFSMPSAGECGGLPSGVRAYYSFDYANAHFICLDSHDTPRSAAGAMAQWLAADLDANRQEWTIAFWHHPPYTKGTHDSDSLSDSSGRMTDMRQILLPILESRGVDLVLNGHSHAYERSRFLNGHYGFSSSFNSAQHVVQPGDGQPDGDGAYRKVIGANPGAVYTVTGSAGQTGSTYGLNHPAMIRSLAQLGSVAVDVNGRQLDLHFIHSSGEVRDRFRIVHNSPPVLSARDVQTVENLPAGVALTASDADGDTLTVDIATPPSHGTLTGAFPRLVWTPDPGWSGTDNCTVRVSDGREFSALVTIALTALRDSDGDLLPDTWELASFGNLGLGAADDPDADGQDNRCEFVAGFSPADANDRLILSFAGPVPGGTAFHINHVQPAVTYQLEASSDLVFWETVQTTEFPAEGPGSITDPSAPDRARLFHRLRPVPY